MMERCHEDDRKTLARMRKPAHLSTPSPPSLVNACAAAFKACNRLSQPAILFNSRELGSPLSFSNFAHSMPQATAAYAAGANDSATILHDKKEADDRTCAVMRSPAPPHWECRSMFDHCSAWHIILE
jgi:hypothetical protein